MALLVLTKTSPFSYQCHRCNQCCLHRQVPLNPYEIALLAQHQGVTTGEFIASFVDQETWSLRHQTSGGCVFLDHTGCQVYQSRPLACRLYPLARRSTPSGLEHFALITPEPNTKGVYGAVANSTIEDYLRPQDIDRHVQYADKYLHFFARFLALLKEQADSTERIRDLVLEDLPVQRQLHSKINRLNYASKIYNIDETVTAYCGQHQLALPSTVEAMTDLHLLTLDQFLLDYQLKFRK